MLPYPFVLALASHSIDPQKMRNFNFLSASHALRFLDEGMQALTTTHLFHSQHKTASRMAQVTVRSAG
jgi:hypothetical protein